MINMLDNGSMADSIDKMIVLKTFSHVYVVARRHFSMDKVTHGGQCIHGGQHGHGAQCEHGGEHKHDEYAKDFWLLVVVSRHCKGRWLSLWTT